MLYIVDGTGDQDKDVYARQMAGGFCDQMRKKFHGWYHRGPTLAGRETYTIANIVYGAIKKYGLLGKEPLFLAGHSRGGAAVIYVAWQLKKSGHSVDALFLFDAVERSATRQNTPLRGGKISISYRRTSKSRTTPGGILRLKIN